MKPTLLLPLLVFLSILACKRNEKDYDASGSFEAIERTISAEATGKILELSISEGDHLEAGQTIGKIDVSNLTLQGEQVQSTIQAIGQKTNDASAQVSILESQLLTQQGQTAALEQQLENIDGEVQRFQKLVDANAVPRKQLDDLKGQRLVLEKQLAAAQTQYDVINQQIAAARDNVAIQNRSILSEVGPTKKRLELIQKQIDDGQIINEFPGTVLTQIAYDGEFTAIGRPLYKIADLSELILRAYITGDQLPQIRLNQIVTVRTDDGEGGYQSTDGEIIWISDEAEFTPKTIQTKDERANLVYAIKVKVKNDGRYKIGMYGEVIFTNENS